MYIQVGAGVLNQTPLDWDGNRDNVLFAIDQARAQRVRLLCLPELCLTGYGCEDAFHSVATQRTAIDVLEEITPHTVGIAVSVGLPIFFRGGVYNTACLIVDGQIQGFVGKQNLAGEGLHYEPRWFKPWPPGVSVDLPLRNGLFPLGDLVFHFGDFQLGFEICEDAWVASRPGGQLASEGVDMLLNPSASHFAFGKHEVRKRFVLEGSRAFHVAYVYANLLGNESGRAIFDGDAMIASCGNLLATGPRFSYRTSHVTTALIDIDQVRVSRGRANNFRTLLDDDRRHVKVRFELAERQLDKLELPPETFPSKTTASTTTAVTSSRAARDTGDQATNWESSLFLKEEEFTRAVSLGLFDYMRKSRSRGFVVSLSGGADSAAVAALCSLSLMMAQQQLSSDQLAQRLDYAHLTIDDHSSLIRQLLTCVYQGTRNSSETTRDAAESMASALSAHYIYLNVDEQVQGYQRMISAALERELSWDRDDLALQNIQARVRGPSVWMLANIQGALLLATSNRSEAAVGYATMDGDTCGGLSPIAGIDKAFLRSWLQWLQNHGPAGVALPSDLRLALDKVTSQAPTAELRPREQGQTDESDLMPYDLLDAIERAAIRDKKGPVEVFDLMGRRFPKLAPGQLKLWVKRFYRLWSRNQWKRERYAPSFHLDDENLDPKTWCRFPILSGGYRRELDQLDSK